MAAAAEKFRAAPSGLTAGTTGPGQPGGRRLARGAKAEALFAQHDASRTTRLAPTQPVQGPAAPPKKAARPSTFELGARSKSASGADAPPLKKLAAPGAGRTRVSPAAKAAVKVDTPRDKAQAGGMTSTTKASGPSGLAKIAADMKALHDEVFAGQTGHKKGDKVLSTFAQPPGAAPREYTVTDDAAPGDMIKVHRVDAQGRDVNVRIPPDSVQAKPKGAIERASDAIAEQRGLPKSDIMADEPGPAPITSARALLANPDNPAAAYEKNDRATNVILARQAGISVRGKSNDQLAAALRAKDEESRAKRAKKLNPSAVGAPSTQHEQHTPAAAPGAPAAPEPTYRVRRSAYSPGGLIRYELVRKDPDGTEMHLGSSDREADLIKRRRALEAEIGPAEPAAKLEKEEAKLRARLDAMRAKRVGNPRKRATAAELDVIERLQNIAPRLARSRREERAAAERANPRGLGGMTGLDQRVLDQLIKNNLTKDDTDRLDALAASARANGSVPPAVARAARQVAGDVDHDNAALAEYRRLLGLPTPDRTDQMVEVDASEVRFGDVVSVSGFGMQVSTITGSGDTREVSGVGSTRDRATLTGRVKVRRPKAEAAREAAPGGQTPDPGGRRADDIARTLAALPAGFVPDEQTRRQYVVESRGVWHVGTGEPYYLQDMKSKREALQWIVDAQRSRERMANDPAARRPGTPYGRYGGMSGADFAALPPERQRAIAAELVAARDDARRLGTQDGGAALLIGTFGLSPTPAERDAGSVTAHPSAIEIVERDRKPATWIDKRTGAVVSNPGQVGIVRGDIVKAGSDAGKAAVAARAARRAAAPAGPVTGAAALEAAPLRIHLGRLRNTPQGMTPQQAQAAATALEHYRDIGYLDLNRDLRIGSTNNKTIARTMEGLRGAFAASPLQRDVVTYRGTGDLKMIGSAKVGSAVGKTWTDAAPGSTTIDEATARGFGQGGAVLRIRVPAGVGAVQLSDAPGRGKPDDREGELLLQDGLTYRVTGDRVERGVRVLDVEASRVDTSRDSRQTGGVSNAPTTEATMFDADKTDEQMRAESQTRRAAVRAKLDAATTEKEARDALYGQSVAQLERILRDLGGNPTPGAGDVSLKRSIAARVLEGKAAPSAPAASTEAKMTQATAAQRRVPRLFEADDEREAIEALHARGRADLRRIADEIGAPIVPGSSETRMKEQIARHVLKLDQGYDERDNLLMEAQRRGIDVKPTDSMDTLRRNVRPVAPAPAKPKSKLTPIQDASLRHLVERGKASNAAEEFAARKASAEKYGAPVHDSGDAMAKLEGKGLVEFTASGYEPTTAGRQHVANTSPAGPHVAKTVQRTGAVSRPIGRAPNGYTAPIPADRKERLNDKAFTDHVKTLTLVANTGDQARAWGFTSDDRPVQVGDEVMVDTFGRLRRGIVTDVTRGGMGNARIAYATPSGGHVQETTAPHVSVWQLVDPTKRPRENRAALLPPPPPEARGPRRMTDEEKAASKAARQEAEKADAARRRQKFFDDKINSITKALNGEPLSNTPEWHLQMTTEEGLVSLAKHLGVKVPNRAKDEFGRPESRDLHALRASIIDAVRARQAPRSAAPAAASAVEARGDSVARHTTAPVSVDIFENGAGQIDVGPASNRTVYDVSRHDGRWHAERLQGPDVGGDVSADTLPNLARRIADRHGVSGMVSIQDERESGRSLSQRFEHAARTGRAPVRLRDLPVGATDADRNRLMPRIPGESDLAYQLRNAPSDDYALRVLNGYSVAGLRAIARDENVAVRSGATKPQLIDAIMEIRRRWRDSMAVSR